jgi:hypothetical protein
MSWVGNGTITMPGYTKPKGGKPYTATNVTVVASLLEPVRISPVQHIHETSPETVVAVDCSNSSRSPAWVISDFIFTRNYHTVWIDFMNHYNDLSFKIRNIATEHEVTCSISVRELAGVSSVVEDWYSCERRSGGSLSVAYDREYSWIGVKELWSCNDTDSNSYGLCHILSPLIRSPY